MPCHFDEAAAVVFEQTLMIFYVNYYFWETSRLNDLLIIHNDLFFYLK